MMDSDITPQDIVTFWSEIGPDGWYKKNDDVDEAIRSNYHGAYKSAANGQFDHWQDHAGGTLGLLILLDQFPRNMYRGSDQSFATDPQALRVAKLGIERGFHTEIEIDLRQFFSTPFMHSENLADQEYGVSFSKEYLSQLNYEYAVIHRDIIKEFGRFPHRNEILERKTSDAEQAFLDKGGFAG